MWVTKPGSYKTVGTPLVANKSHRGRTIGQFYGGGQANTQGHRENAVYTRHNYKPMQVRHVQSADSVEESCGRLTVSKAIPNSVRNQLPQRRFTVEALKQGVRAALTGPMCWRGGLVNG